MALNLKISITLRQKKSHKSLKLLKVIIRLLEESTSNYTQTFPSSLQNLSTDPLNLQDMDDDIKANGQGIKKITDNNNAEDFMTIFQTFYQLSGRLPLSNGLLVIPDGNPLQVKIELT